MADVYDALTSKRIYKDEFSIEVAQSIILNESGTHFDPAVAEAFENNMDEFAAIKEKFSEREKTVIL